MKYPKTFFVVRCLYCSSRATNWTRHIHLGKQKIIAGACNQHFRILVNAVDRKTKGCKEGCMGLWLNRDEVVVVDVK